MSSSEPQLSSEELVAEREAARVAALAIAPGVLFAGVSGGIVFPILPIVGVKAGLSLPFIGVILAANRFGRVIVNPFAGAAVDRLGGKRLLVFGLLSQTLVLGCYLAGVLSGHPGAFFLIGRLLHGPSSSCVLIAAGALALHAGGRNHRGLAAGITNSAMAAGVPLGLALGGLIAGWRGPAAAFGSALVALFLAAFVALVRAPDLRAAHVDRAPSFRQIFSSLRHRPVQALAALNAATSFSALGVVLATLALIIHARRLTLFSMSEQTAAGAFMAVLVVFMTIAGPLAGRLSDHPGHRLRIMMLGIGALVPGVLAFGFAHSSLVLLIGLALVGLGTGAVTTPLLATLGDVVPLEERGRAIGCLQLFGDAGGVLGPILGVSFLSMSSILPYAGTAALLVVTALFVSRALGVRGAADGLG